MLTLGAASRGRHARFRANFATPCPVKTGVWPQGAGPDVGGDANGASQAGTTIRGMPTRKRFHQEVDAVPDLVNPIDDPWKDCVPFQGDVSDLVSLTHDLTDEQREQQRAHWRKVREELKAEGADGSRYLPELEAEAELEDAQAASSLVARS